MTIDEIISKWSSFYQVPVDLVKAVITTESNFNPSAKNPESSASGLMQVVRGTWDWMTSVFHIPASWSDRFDPEANVQVGTAYLSYNLKRYHGDVRQAVAAYYSGTPNGSPDEQSYVNKVLSHFQSYNDGGNTYPPTQAGPSGDGTGGSGPGTLEVIFLAGAAITALLFMRRIL